MKLVYIPKAGFECPGDGWPAADHDEPSVRLAARKIKSGFYRDQNNREAQTTESASKREANAKAREQATTAIASADAAVTSARDAAHKTRVEHGKAK